MKESEVIKILKYGGVGVIPTDTVYGLVGSAPRREVVERIYRVRKRERNKPFIVLIGSMRDLKRFGAKVSREHLNILKALWPGPVSVILPVPRKKFSYIHRGRNSIAFRLPRDKWLRGFLKKTGPLVAPSANVAGKKPAETITQAQKYFGRRIDFYFGKGKLRGKPSSVVAILR